MRVQRKASEPIREELDIEARWKGADQGLIAAWEAGRRLRDYDTELANRALTGELVILPWKGGVERSIKSGQKYGSKRYLAMWQGLRGKDLDVDLETDSELECAVTKMTVIFTSDTAKYAGLG